MKVQSKYFGEIDCEKEDILTFPAGLFAATLLCFQSLQTPALAFVAMDPFALNPDYAPVLQAQELKALGVTESQALGYYVLCVVKNPVSDSTVNLKCPVAINPETRVAYQVILDTEDYEMRHPLAEFSKGGAPC